MRDAAFLCHTLLPNVTGTSAFAVLGHCGMLLVELVLPVLLPPAAIVYSSGDGH